MLDDQDFNLSGTNQRMITNPKTSQGFLVNFMITHSAGFVDTPGKATVALLAISVLLLSIAVFLFSSSEVKVNIDPATGYPVNEYINPGYR